MGSDNVPEENNTINAVLNRITKALNGVGNNRGTLRVSASEDARAGALVVDALNLYVVPDLSVSA